MRKLSLLAFVTLTCASAFAFPSFDPFNDTAGTVLWGKNANTGETWLEQDTGATTATSAAVVIFSDNLSYTVGSVPSGFASSASLWASLPNAGGSGEGAQLPVTPNVSGAGNAVYCSFYFQIASFGAMATTPTFNIALDATAGSDSANHTTLGARLYTKKSGVGYLLGAVRDSSTASDIQFDTTTHSSTELLFVVLAYQFGSSSSLDDAYLWIDPPSSSFGNSSAPTSVSAPGAFVTAPQTGGTLAKIVGVDLMNRLSTTAAQSLVGQLRVGSTWAYVTGGPEIDVQPVATTNINAGQNLILSVTANVAGPALSYQWSGPSGVINGATSSSLTVPSILQASAGSYSCVVNNTIGTVTSSNSVVTVNDPAILLQPVASTNVAPGTTVILSVTASGTPNLTYKWNLNGANLTDDGANIINSATPSLTLNNVSAASDGTYTCDVTNSLDSFVISSNSVLTVFDPAIIANPQSVTTNYGATVNFSVTAAGTAPLTYQWYYGGAPLSDGTSPGATISGSTKATLTLAGVAFTNDGSYSVVVTNGNSVTVSSASATLTVNDPYIVTQPASAIALSNSTATFAVTANGSGTISYQWYFGTNRLSNAGNITGSATPTLTIASAQPTNAGSYTVQIIGASAITNISSVATLTVQNPPSIVSPLISRVERVGDNMAFAVSVSGTGPFTYQWTKNGNSISDTSNVLTLANIQLSNAGTYKVTVSGDGPPAVSTATLTVQTGLVHLSTTNLVISRVGDGAQILNSGAGNTLYLDQYATDGNYLSSIMIPDNTNSNTSALIVNGQDGSGGAVGLSESVLGVSPNDRFLGFGGYNVSRPYSGTLNTDTAALAPRCAGTINGLGYYNLAWRSTTASSTSQRSALPDNTGTNFWTTGGSGGLRYVYNGSSTILNNVGTNGNNRVVQGFTNTVGGTYNLFISSASSGNPGTHDLFTTPGLPTNAAGVSLGVVFGDGLSSPSTPQNAEEFAVSPDDKTVYIADCAFGSQSPGSLQRWDNNGSSWSLTYSNIIVTPSGSGGVRSVLVDFSAFTGGGSTGTGAVVYATTGETNANYLIGFVDNGPTWNIQFLAEAGTNTIFRSVRFGPIADPPSIVTAPQSQMITNQPVTFSVVAAGSAPLTYQWKFNSGNMSGATQSSLTLTGGGIVVGSYSVIVANDIGTATSTALLTPTPGNDPLINSIAISGTNIVMSGTNGVQGAAYYILTSTNLGVPATNWTVLATNYFDTSGNFIFSNGISTKQPQRFFMISTP